MNYVPVDTITSSFKSNKDINKETHLIEEYVTRSVIAKVENNAIKIYKQNKFSKKKNLLIDLNLKIH